MAEEFIKILSRSSHFRLNKSHTDNLWNTKNLWNNRNLICIYSITRTVPHTFSQIFFRVRERTIGVMGSFRANKGWHKGPTYLIILYSSTLMDAEDAKEKMLKDNTMD